MLLATQIHAAAAAPGNVYIFPTLDWAETATRLGMAMLFGILVGLEREWRERAAGLRTHMLVCVGSAAMTIVSAYGWPDFYAATVFPEGAAPPVRDPARLAAQIVSGIGFLGGGVILRSGYNVSGLTTAASLWAICGVGIAAGAGMYTLAALLTAALLFGLTILKRVNDVMESRFHHENARIKVRISSGSFDSVMKTIETNVYAVDSFAIEGADLESDDDEVIANVRLRAGIDRVAIGRELRQVRGVSGIEVGEARRR